MRPQATPLDMGFAIAGFGAARKKPLIAAEIVQELCLRLPTVHRLIGNLETRQMVQRAMGTRGYEVSNQLGISARRTMSSIFRPARRCPGLQRMAAEIGGQCETRTMRDSRIASVDRVRVADSQGLQLEPGDDAPPHGTLTGTIYRRRLPAAARRKRVRSLPLRAYTRNWRTDPDALSLALEKVRARRRARWTEDDVHGVVGCAVPISAEDGTLIACLGVPLSTARVGYEGITARIEPVLRVSGIAAETILDGKEEAMS